MYWLCSLSLSTAGLRTVHTLKGYNFMHTVVYGDVLQTKPGTGVGKQCSDEVPNVIWFGILLLPGHPC